MGRKYAVLLGIVISISLLVVATWYYPGGSQADINSVGYSWKNNYISNLFGEKAVNGAANAGRYWAVPLHDIMVTLLSTMFLVSIFYITVFIFKSKLLVFMLLCVICLLVFYTTLYVYGSGNFRAYLPVMQKITFASTIILIVGWAYFTSAEDFAHIKAGKKSYNENFTLINSPALFAECYCFWTKQ